MNLDFWVILSSSLVGIACSTLGCFIILRRQAMLSDAISHAVLPAIVLGYLLAGSLKGWIMLFSASLMGLASTLMIEYLQNKFRIQNDSAMGIVFTFLFALGIILTTSAAGMVDLDLDCVLYGDLAVSILDTGVILGFSVPNVSFSLLLISLFNLAFVGVFYRVLFLTTFDSSYGASIGVSILRWHYLLVGVVSLSTVVSFEAVGAILVVAFFVVPAACAYLLTDELKKMILIAAAMSVVASMTGYYLAKIFNSSITAMISSVLGLLFGLCFLYYKSRKSLFAKLRVH